METINTPPIVRMPALRDDSRTLSRSFIKKPLVIRRYQSSQCLIPHKQQPTRAVSEKSNLALPEEAPPTVCKTNVKSQ